MLLQYMFAVLHPKVTISSFQLSKGHHYFWTEQVKFIFITRPLLPTFTPNFRTVKISRSCKIAALTHVVVGREAAITLRELQVLSSLPTNFNSVSNFFNLLRRLN